MSEAETPRTASLPFAASLCHRCRAVRYVETKRSVFVLCTAIAAEKYPPQPVSTCRSFEPRPVDGDER